MFTLTAAPIFSLVRWIMKILVYGINYSPELTGIEYTSEMVNGWQHKVMRAGLLPRRLTTRSGRWARTIRLAFKQEGGRHGVAFPCTCKTMSTLNACCISVAVSSFFPRRSVAGADHIGVVPTLFCMRWLLAKLSGALRCSIFSYRVDAMLGLGLADKA